MDVLNSTSGRAELLFLRKLATYTFPKNTLYCVTPKLVTEHLFEIVFFYFTQEGNTAHFVGSQEDRHKGFC